MTHPWDPFSEASSEHASSTAQVPPVDIYDDGSCLVLKADVPGYEPEQLHVDLQDNVLTIRGDTHSSQEESHQGYVRMERKRASFSRTFILPGQLHANQAEARLHQGMLTIRLPREATSQPSKSIPIEALNGIDESSAMKRPPDDS